MSSILSFIGWAILPGYATSIIQNIYYGITIRAGDPRPQPQSPRYIAHRRRIFILVVTSYLLYTLYEAYYQVRVAGDFYQVLGVSPLADDKTIKSRFRRLAAQHHPDKVQQQQFNGDGSPSGADDFFVYLKLAQDTLLDPARRFAYDRFGPELIGRPEGQTMQSFFYGALYKMIPEYLGGFLLIGFLNFVWWSQWGRYWRFYTFTALLALHLGLITHPRAIFIPVNYLPEKLLSLLSVATNPPTFYLLPFQIMSLARRVALSSHIFISQIGPSPTTKPSGTPGSPLDPQVLQNLAQLVTLAQVTDAEATRLLDLGFAPFRGDRKIVATLRQGMKEGLVLGGVRNTPEVIQAVERVRQRKRNPPMT